MFTVPMSKKHLTIPGYLCAVLLASFPLVDSLLAVWPLRLGELSWRFGSAGLVSRTLLTPLLWLLLAYAIALLAEQRRVLRGISILSALITAMIVALIPLFLLDAVQMRAQVVPAAIFAFTVASVAALAKYMLAAIVTLSFAIFGWKASRRSRVAGHAREGTRESRPTPDVLLTRPGYAIRTAPPASG